MISIKKATKDDLDILCVISKDTFMETFYDMYDKGSIDRYCKEAFNQEKILKEIETEGSYFFLAYVDEKIAGYTKVNIGDAEIEKEYKDSLEIQRIYILKEFQNQHVGKALMEHDIAFAKSLDNIKYIWLGVAPDNYKAQRFYKSFGFYKIGSHIFYLDDLEQSDDIVRLDL